jgi:hypothetical protein
MRARTGRRWLESEEWAVLTGALLLAVIGILLIYSAATGLRVATIHD